MVIYYKLVRLIGEKPRWVIEDKDGNIINKNPTKEQVRSAIDAKYRPEKCHKCGDATIPGRRRYVNEKLLCYKCYMKYYNSLPDSHNSLKKSISSLRTNNISNTATSYMGILGEAVIAKVRKLKVHSIETNNFCLKLDLSLDREYDIIQSKLRTPYCGEIYKDWKVSFGTEHHFNTLFVLCVSKDRRNIERVYAILEKELYGLNGISLTRSYSKYDKFRIDEKPYNDAYHNLMEFLKDKKYFGIEDIKKWLEDD